MVWLSVWNWFRGPQHATWVNENNWSGRSYLPPLTTILLPHWLPSRDRHSAWSESSPNSVHVISRISSEKDNFDRRISERLDCSNDLSAQNFNTNVSKNACASIVSHFRTRWSCTGVRRNNFYSHSLTTSRHPSPTFANIRPCPCWLEWQGWKSRRKRR